jgi:hypothetical protein
MPRSNLHRLAFRSGGYPRRVSAQMERDQVQGAWGKEGALRGTSFVPIRRASGRWRSAAMGRAWNAGSGAVIGNGRRIREPAAGEAGGAGNLLRADPAECWRAVPAACWWPYRINRWRDWSPRRRGMRELQLWVQAYSSSFPSTETATDNPSWNLSWFISKNQSMCPFLLV